MKIAGFEDPYELWAAGIAAPGPEDCKAKNANGLACSFKSQGGLGYCKKHYEKNMGKPYEEPPFTYQNTTGIHVWWDDDRILLAKAVLMLKLGREFNLGCEVYRLKKDSDYPDDLQEVPASVIREAREQNHPEGVLISWTEEEGKMKYNPMSVRLSSDLIDFLDREVARVGWSRNKLVEYYLTQGMQFGDPAKSAKTVVAEINENGREPHRKAT